MLRTALFVMAFGVAISPAVAQSPLSDDAVQRAIAEGMRYRTRGEYLERGTKGHACKIAGLFAMDGISKEIRFFTDYDIVASAAAAANAEMRSFTLADARQLPLTGLVLANVRMTARGMIPVRELQSKYVKNGVHLVLRVNDTLVQPIKKESASAETSGGEIATLYGYWGSNNIGLLTGVPLGFQKSEFQQEFVYPTHSDVLPRELTAFMIDSDGNRKQVSCRTDGLGSR